MQLTEGRSCADQSSGAAATEEAPQQPEPAADVEQADASAEGIAGPGQHQQTGAETSVLPDAGAASMAEQQPDEQPAAAASALVAGATAGQEMAQQPGPAVDGGAESAPGGEAEVESQAEALEADEAADKTQGAEHAATAEEEQQGPLDGSAVTPEVPEVAASTDGGVESSVEAAGAVQTASEEAAAAAEAAAEGISNPAAIATLANEGEASVKETMTLPTAVSGSRGGVSDEDLAAEAAEAKRRRQVQ